MFLPGTRSEPERAGISPTALGTAGSYPCRRGPSRSSIAQSAGPKHGPKRLTEHLQVVPDELGPGEGPAQLDVLQIEAGGARALTRVLSNLRGPGPSGGHV